jgi:prepilin-type N-terminal cleavage/methylation domain-containing protein
VFIMKRHSNESGQAGFTIVELMIATVIFAVVLLVITAGILQFTRQYYRGIIASNTQNVARALVDDVARSLQFNAGGFEELTKVSAADSTTNVKGYCVGDNKRYSFGQNWQVTPTRTIAKHQGPHGLVSDDYTGCSSTTYADNVKGYTSKTFPAAYDNPRELLGEHMRLSNFKIEALPGSVATYKITVRVVYGDDDLLCSPSLPAAAAGGCDNNGTPGAAIDNSTDLRCKAKAGSQFCAASELSTVVKKRVN